MVESISPSILRKAFASAAAQFQKGIRETMGLYPWNLELPNETSCPSHRVHARDVGLLAVSSSRGFDTLIGFSLICRAARSSAFMALSRQCTGVRLCPLDFGRTGYSGLRPNRSWGR
jgi:hypothetical protein